MFKFLLSCNAILLLLLIPNTLLYCCTGIRLKTTNDAIICARTLEFDQLLDSSILIIPRNYSFSGTALSGKPEGLQWKARYAVVGTNALKSLNIVEGVNEKGLAGGMFYFPGFAEYQDVLESEQAKTLGCWEVISWILTNCATTQEVKEMLPKIRVAKIVFPAWGTIPPLHYSIHDAQGNSIVIEYVKSKLTIHDNTIGVLTNSPAFDWHLTNLRNYINLTPNNVQKKDSADLTLKPLGQGSGMLGLPGDFTPPSRFVRATAFSQAALSVDTEQEAVHQAFHILNQFDIPRGAVRDYNKKPPRYDYTQWTSVIDTKNKRFYVRTYENFQPQMVDLMKLPLDAKEVVTLPITHKEIIIDLTPAT